MHQSRLCHLSAHENGGITDRATMTFQRIHLNLHLIGRRHTDDNNLVFTRFMPFLIGFLLPNCQIKSWFSKSRLIKRILACLEIQSLFSSLEL